MYKELYKKIIDTVLNENRTKGGDIYYEEHHIVPDFMFKNRKRRGPKGHLDGDPDAPYNKVLLTFQEHLLSHYYLYEIYKDSRYGYSAGSALQFFFVKATGSHKRQIQLSEVDLKFLEEMDHLRKIGIDSISKARKGTMPVVDAVTKQSIGSVSIDHPKVLSGEWHHHSKGKPSPSKPENRKNQKGAMNNNFKEMTQERRERVYQCVFDSVEDNHLILKTMIANIKKEFTEFKKISIQWINNNFGTIDNLLTETNDFFGVNIQYSSYYRSKSQRKLLSEISSQYCWSHSDSNVKQLKKSEREQFLKNNPEYKSGKGKVK